MGPNSPEAIDNLAQRTEENFQRFRRRLPDGSPVPLTERESENYQIAMDFARRGSAIRFDAHGWSFVDDDPSNWDPTR